jgi:Flp pilus assembly protein TadD
LINNPILKRALELDPQFAKAHLSLGLAYWSLHEDALANTEISKAFELRNKASERERYSISAEYYGEVTGEIEKANQIYEQWARAYPRDPSPRADLGTNYAFMGRHEESLAKGLEVIQLDSQPDAQDYGVLIASYFNLERLNEAKASYMTALRRNLDGPFLHGNRYFVAFLEGDRAEMQRQLDWGIGRPGVEDAFLSIQADTEAHEGRMEIARNLSKQAAETADRNSQKEAAALWLLDAALREAEVGNSVDAVKFVNSGLSLTATPHLQAIAALALARSGSITRAKRTADDLHTRFPLNTFLNTYWLPCIFAAIDLQTHHNDVALEPLQRAISYELGLVPPLLGGTLYPAYLRGEARLAKRQGAEAVTEFQKLINHRGIVSNFVFDALVHLQLGRAKVISGDTEGGKSAYRDFFRIWKNADPSISILKQAKTEYAMLQ